MEVKNNVRSADEWSERNLKQPRVESLSMRVYLYHGNEGEAGRIFREKKNEFTLFIRAQAAGQKWKLPPCGQPVSLFGAPMSNGEDYEVPVERRAVMRHDDDSMSNNNLNVLSL